MLTVIVVVLALWIALSIVGALIEGLLWLTILGGLLFLGTAGYARVKRKTEHPTS